MAGVDVELTAAGVRAAARSGCSAASARGYSRGDVEAAAAGRAVRPRRCPAAGPASSTRTASPSASRCYSATSSPPRWRVPGVAWVEVDHASPGWPIPRRATAANLVAGADRGRGPRGAALRQRPEQPRGRPGRHRDRGRVVTTAGPPIRRPPSTRPRTRRASPSCTGRPRRMPWRWPACAPRSPPPATISRCAAWPAPRPTTRRSRCWTRGRWSPTSCPSTPSGSPTRVSCAPPPNARRSASSPARSATSCAPASPPRPTWRSRRRPRPGAPEVVIVPAGTPVQSVPGARRAAADLRDRARTWRPAPAWNAHRRGRLADRRRIAADDEFVWLARHRSPSDRETPSSSPSRPLPPGTSGVPGRRDELRTVTNDGRRRPPGLDPAGPR